MKKGFWAMLLLLLAFQGFSQSNEGTDFWMGFMEHRDQGNNTMVVMITAKTATTGVVSIPLRGWSTTFSVAANQVSLITMPREAENLGSESVDNRGIHVTAQDAVSVYIHQYHGFRSEASIVLPTDAIDQDYYVLAYTGITQGGTYYPSEFLMVATQDDTEVSYTLSANTRQGKAAGSTHTITLNAGQSYQVQTQTQSGDVTGTLIQSDKKLAVFAGASWSQVPESCGPRDNLLEQMYPISTWGRRFVTIPNARVNYDVYRILASEDNTVVELDGANPRVFNLDAGEYAEYQSNASAFITANNPILVAQYLTGSSCNGIGISDPSYVLLNSIEQTRDVVTLYNSSFQNISENYINIIAQTADINNITIDGLEVVNSGNTFTPVGANALFSYTQVRVSAGSHTIASGGCGVIVTAYGYGDVESYAYNGGASFTAINANAIPEGACLNDTLAFDTGLSEVRYTALWDLGDGTTTTEHRFDHIYDQLGSYPVTLITYDRCLDESDTSFRNLLVTLRQAVTATDEVSVCEGAPFQLFASDLAGARYEWAGPNGYFSFAQQPEIAVSNPAQSGIYSVIGIISGCATFPAEAVVAVHPTPQPFLGEDTIICTRGDFELLLDPGAYSLYRWQDNSRMSTFQVQDEGTFQVEVTDEFGCIATDELVLTEQCPTQVYAPNVFSPNRDGINDQFRLFATDIISFEMKIYDRWGSLMFTTTNQEEAWDGFWRGKPCQSGVYLWTATFEGYREDGSTFTTMESNSVTLIR